MIGSRVVGQGGPHPPTPPAALAQGPGPGPRPWPKPFRSDHDSILSRCRACRRIYRPEGLVCSRKE